MATQEINRPASVWSNVEGLGFGGDYNPEQWPVSVRLEDLELMQEAGVNFLSVGIFSWALLEPVEGQYDFGWLDEVLDNLAGIGVRVALATATAAPPAWLVRKHPEILPVTADGTVLGPGSRRHYTPSSAAYRRYATGITRVLAERYKDHPALALWHVDNELGCHISEFYGKEDAAAFRSWLERRYGSIDALNASWGTAFWSQNYASFEEILPPSVAPSTLNPGQQLDFQRFNSWALMDYYRELVAVLREVTPEVPCTTNLMASSATKSMDYFSWAKDLDVIANDHYLVAADPERHIELAFSADLTRGIAGGDPWILMEHSTSAVNWQPRNQPKMPGEMLRNSLAHVARGADAVMFFQWRQSFAGSEKFHSAMVPHGGRDTRVWREVVDLGAALKLLEPVRGSRVESRAAIVFDYEAWWASEIDSKPSIDVKYLDLLRAFHRSLFLKGVSVDMVHPSAPLEGYDLVLVCTLYAVSDADAGNIAAAASAGATVLVSYFSGIADPQDHIRLGGYPGAFRDLLGVRVEEFHPLLAGSQLKLDDGTVASVWSEHVHLAGAEAVQAFTEYPLEGVPALTRRSVGAGAAWYLATFPDSDGIDALVERLLAESGVSPAAAADTGVELVRRRSADGQRFLFAINHTRSSAAVSATGTDLLTGEPFGGSVPAGSIAVIREG
ncbi:Beta-galactosidase [Pseudarthrobacter chlorophenolicus A6]|uniref:Beta-galactosidase n=1 Tax=Pseudarthrobacter chlorophenolicus (strain ATCC 700700 / DSM 12829 / CIP 107037 / JCM 12360 / KCTC 9906 / NCIMB 13794 / A6) TaxID=452863 RepID=B8HFB8_PSECP|nr:beta-galactosidase [Pseudarthrobacter chlorophenolicus]ACL41086.1 Beta-galactosidase [Pseudarthrobacter chlorophenolicus A6]SDQ70153.1 beta-galactosidase [Pseudarthrobacter chlorophenolicus]